MNLHVVVKLTLESVRTSLRGLMGSGCRGRQWDLSAGVPASCLRCHRQSLQPYLYTGLQPPLEASRKKMGDSEELKKS